MADQTNPPPQDPNAAAPAPAAESSAPAKPEAATPATATPAAPGPGTTATAAPTPAAPAAPPKSEKIKELFGKVKGGLAGSKGGVIKILSLPKELLLAIKDAFWGGGWSFKLSFLGFALSLFLVVKTGQQIWNLYQAEIAAQYAKAVQVAKKTVDAQHGGHGADHGEDLSPEIEPTQGMFLDRMQGTLTSALGESKAYEIDVYVVCDSEETRKELEAKRWALQEFIEPLLKDQQSNELMTEKGKEALKKQILQGANDFIKKEFKHSKGKSAPKAVRIYFTRFVLAFETTVVDHSVLS